MMPLPYDYARCSPVFSGPECTNCARWVQHPQQVWGPRTPLTTCDFSGDESCRRIEIKEVE